MRTRLLLSILCCLLLGAAAEARADYIYFGATSSVEDSGLLAAILPKFTEASGIEVRAIVRGSGQILKLGQRGDLDVLMVHHRASEEAFVAAGHGLYRREVMANDFVILGPAADPASIGDSATAAEALAKIARAGASFLSRGDDSGNHKREVALWRTAGLDPKAGPGGWYHESGSGMGATLNAAAVLDSYLLSDRSSWVTFRNKGDLKILLQGDAALHNRYGIIPVNPARHPHVKAEAAQTLVDWLLSPAGQAAIAGFQVEGRQLFFPIGPE